MFTDDKTIFRTKEISERYNIPVTRLTLAIRNGKIKAVKSGKEYLVTLKEINKYLGIDANDGDINKEIYIKELENKINKYEMKISTLENCLNMMQSVLVNG